MRTVLIRSLLVAANSFSAYSTDQHVNRHGQLVHHAPFGADERVATDGRPPAVFTRAAAIASQAVEVVDAALDHSSHRDRAGGRRITVSSSAARTARAEPRQQWWGFPVVIA